MVYEMVPFPETVVLVGVTDVISPDLDAVMTVLLAFVIVTTAKVFGLLFLGNDKDDGADNTQTGGVGEASGDEFGEGAGEVAGDGLGSVAGLGDGSVPGEGDGSDPGEGDGDACGSVVGLGEGSVSSTGLATGEP